MILFDATYVKSHGGLNILSIIIKQLSIEQKKKTCLVIDKKAFINSEDIKHFKEVKKVKSNLIIKFYFYNARKWDKIFSLGNFPSVCFSKTEVFVYNMQFFLFDISMLNGRIKFFWYIKRKLISMFFFLQESSMIFQTNFMKDISNKSSLKIKGKFVYPIYKEVKEVNIKNTPKDFLYITSNHSYKNNQRLIDAWEASSINSKLYLTLENEPKTRKKNIVYLGQISHQKINEFVKKNKPVIIQASEVESFGITCIESSMWGLPLLALKRDYLDSVISDYSYFKSFDSFIKYLNKLKISNLKVPKIVAKNNSIGLIKFIWE